MPFFFRKVPTSYKALVGLELAQELKIETSSLRKPRSFPSAKTPRCVQRNVSRRHLRTLCEKERYEYGNVSEFCRAGRPPSKGAPRGKSRVSTAIPLPLRAYAQSPFFLRRSLFECRDATRRTGASANTCVLINIAPSLLRDTNSYPKNSRIRRGVARARFTGP